MRVHQRVRLLALAYLLALTGCAELGKMAAAAVDPPKLTLKTVNVRALDLEGVTLGFNFDVENRNAFGLEVAKIAYGIEIEGTRVLTGDAPGGLKLPAEKKVPLTFTARVRFREANGIAALLGKRDSVRYKLSGTVGVQTPLGLLDVPIAHEDHIDLPRAPRFSLEGLEIRSVTLKRLSLTVRVRVANPNPFPLPAGRIDAALSLGNSRVVKVENRPISGVAGNGSAVLSIPIDLDLAEAGRAASDLARGLEVPVAVHGEADLAGARLPVELAGRFSASR
jgi:LEA14-like dessication related protein